MRPALPLLLASSLLMAQGPRVAVFQAAGFPVVDARPTTPETIRRALEPWTQVDCDSPERLRAVLTSGVEVLVLPHGSAFPLDAWEAIQAHLRRGKGLVVLGGAPFHQPVRQVQGAWVPGLRQSTFAQRLLIGPSEVLSTAGLEAPAPVPGSGWTRSLPLPGRTWTLTVRFSTRKELPWDEGGDGEREGQLQPLVHAHGQGLPRACPLQEVHRLQGFGSGGRWVFATHDGTTDAETLRALVDRALQGGRELSLHPIHASLEPGEQPRFRVRLHRPGSLQPFPTLKARLHSGKGQPIVVDVPLSGPPHLGLADFTLPLKRALPPGLHRVELLEPGMPSQEVGFWVKDPTLLASGTALTASADWLRQGSRVLPVLGTTYMDSRVHRRFLLEPDPLRWDRDFAAMKAQGVNFVRTGLWGGWNRIQAGTASMDEGVLRALDAYVATAARHGIFLCFTFFAFLPPTFGGENPYLDPRALEGQEALVTRVAARYRHCPWVHYDLINEPSWATPETLWSHRPMGDGFERHAWHTWIQTRFSGDTLLLRDLWRDATDDVWGLPHLGELGHAMVKDGKRPRKVRDFRIFTQEAFATWAERLRKVIQKVGGPALVTVGQDEGGLGLSPSPQLMASSVDYTCIHNWWQNDDLLWDGVAAKVMGRPMLAQETGLMRLEDKDGQPWRSPAEASRLLERKLALSFMARGGGAVQWAWNINPLMPIDNEAVIGFFRPDGTAKEELGALRDMAAFFREAAPHLDDFLPDPVVLVLPQGRQFMGRPLAQEGVKRIVRMLSERFGIVPSLVSDLALEARTLKDARVVLVPTPECLEPRAAEALEAAAQAGTHVLLTGALEGDPYGRPLRRLESLQSPSAPLALREPSPWGTFTFESQITEKLRRSATPSLNRSMDGRLWHHPLPLEYAREEGFRDLVGLVLKEASVPVRPEGDPILSRILETPRVAFLLAVNEGSQDLVREFTSGRHRLRLWVPAGRSRMVLLEKATGRLLAQSPGEPVIVN